MNKCLYKKRVWITFYDSTSGSMDPYDTDTTEENWKSYLSYFGAELIPVWFPTGTGVNNSIQLALLQYIYRRYYEHYIGFTDEREGWEEDSYKYAITYPFLVKLTNIYEQTKDRYVKLIKLYKAEENNLMNSIVSTSSGVGRFNDTPQDITNGDEFGDNTHVSNITKSTAENTTEGDTKIARLSEIRRLLPNLYREWTNEFEELFIESENVI